MASQPLQGEQRQAVLAAVWNVLRAARPDLFDSLKLKQPGGIVILDTHLDALVDLSRSITADRIEPYLARIIDDICAHCTEQGATGYCALRHVGSCVLFSHARLILETLDSALRALGDPEYLASHGGTGAG